MLKKISIAGIAIILMFIAILFIFQKSVGLTIFERAVNERVGIDNLSNLPDGLHLGLCGTGSPLPDVGRAGPCNVVIAGKQSFVIDIGEGGARNLNFMGIAPANVDAVMFTHFHSDHIDGMGPMMLFHWTGGATSPLPIYGPNGLQSIIDGFNAAYKVDNGYRIAHHGEKIVTPSGAGAISKPFVMTSESQVILKRSGLTITAFKVDHNPIEPALGYRFDYKGRSIVISGDTSKSPSLERAAKGADILVHEALQPNLVKKMTKALDNKGLTNTAAITRDILDYHASPEEAAQSAQIAGVKQLILSHLVPPLPSRYFYPAFLGDAKEHFNGPIIVGEDGMFFTLPANTDVINYDELM